MELVPPVCVKLPVPEYPTYSIHAVSSPVPLRL